jgi:hypothetical protein
MQHQHIKGDAPWFGQAIGSPGHDGLGPIQEEGSNGGAYMHGALAESGAAGAAGAAGVARAGHTRAASSLYGQERDDPYGLDSYYDTEGKWMASSGVPIPPPPVRHGHDQAYGGGYDPVGRPGSGGYGQKFTHMYWDNLDGGRDRIDQAPQVRHDELPGRLPRSPHDPYRGELE